MWESQTECALSVKHGNKDRILELWELLQPFTNNYIRRYLKGSERLYSAEDLKQEAYIAMVEAVELWQPERGQFLNVYAWRIKRHARGMRNESDAAFNAVSLDKPMTGETEDRRVNFLPDTSDDMGDAEQREYYRECAAIIDDICSTQMTPNQQEVIKRRYYDRQTYAQIGERIGLSVQRCRCLEFEALRICRRPRNLKRLEVYAGQYKGVGVRSFRERQASSVELAVEFLNTITHVNFSELF